MCCICVCLLLLLDPQMYTFWAVVIIKHLYHMYSHVLFTRGLLSEKTGLLNRTTESVKTILYCVYHLTTPLCISELIELHPVAHGWIVSASIQPKT